ncbi:MAG: hypothetical protein ACKN9W_08505 [Methylococcus sp.]
MRDFAETTRRDWLQQLSRRPLKLPARTFRWQDDTPPTRDATADPLRARLMEFRLADGRWIVGVREE